MKHSFDWIIFDFGNVLSQQQDTAVIAGMAARLDVQPSRFLDLYDSFRRPYDRGDLDALGYWSQKLHAADRSCDGTIVDELVNLDIKSWSAVNPQMLAWNQRLRAAGCRTGILSNMPKDHSRFFRSHAEWIGDFDEILFSGELRLVPGLPESRPIPSARQEISTCRSPGLWRPASTPIRP